jgi:hypothetical protein
MVTATQELERLATTVPGFPVTVLRYLSTNPTVQIGQAGAAFFKNFVKRRWVPDVSNTSKHQKTTAPNVTML